MIPGHAFLGAKFGLLRGVADPPGVAFAVGVDRTTDASETTSPTFRFVADGATTPPSLAAEGVGARVVAAAVAVAAAADSVARVAHVEASPNARTPMTRGGSRSALERQVGTP